MKVMIKIYFYDNSIKLRIIIGMISRKKVGIFLKNKKNATIKSPTISGKQIQSEQDDSISDHPKFCLIEPEKALIAKSELHQISFDQQNQSSIFNPPGNPRNQNSTSKNKDYSPKKHLNSEEYLRKNSEQTLGWELNNNNWLITSYQYQTQKRQDIPKQSSSQILNHSSLIDKNKSQKSQVKIKTDQSKVTIYKNGSKTNGNIDDLFKKMKTQLIQERVIKVNTRQHNKKCEQTLKYNNRLKDVYRKNKSVLYERSKMPSSKFLLNSQTVVAILHPSSMQTENNSPRTHYESRSATKNMQKVNKITVQACFQEKNPKKPLQKNKAHPERNRVAINTAHKDLTQKIFSIKKMQPHVTTEVPKKDEKLDKFKSGYLSRLQKWHSQHSQMNIIMNSQPNQQINPEFEKKKVRLHIHPKKNEGGVKIEFEKLKKLLVKEQKHLFEDSSSCPIKISTIGQNKEKKQEITVPSKE